MTGNDALRFDRHTYLASFVEDFVAHDGKTFVGKSLENIASVSRAALSYYPMPLYVVRIHSEIASLFAF